MASLRRGVRPLLLLALPTALLGCGGEKQYTVQFAAQVGSQPLRCDASYPDIGTTRSTVQLLDFKAYVRDVTLVRANGERHPLVLEQDGRWQREGIALLDFEDGTGSCTSGSADVRTTVVGRAPDFDDYTGVELKLGLPPELNHLDGATAAPPLDVPGMWWSWKSGYKFLRLEVRSDQNAAFMFHLGASGCEGTPAQGYTCATESQTSFSLTGFHPERNRIVLDVAALLSGSDLNHQVDGTTDYVSGCMSEASDPECGPLMSRLGLGPEPAPAPGPGAFLRSE